MDTDSEVDEAAYVFSSLIAVIITPDKLPSRLYKGKDLDQYDATDGFLVDDEAEEHNSSSEVEDEDEGVEEIVPKVDTRSDSELSTHSLAARKSGRRTSVIKP